MRLGSSFRHRRRLGFECCEPRRMLAYSVELVADINGRSDDANPDSLTLVGDVVYFTADDGVHGRELWQSDGTAQGTVLVKDLIAGAVSSFPQDLVALDGELFFTAEIPKPEPNRAPQRSLFKSDGTAEGTVEILQFTNGDGELSKIDDSLYVTGNRFGMGELWKIESSDVEPERLWSSNLPFLNAFLPDGPVNELPQDLTDVDGELYFTTVVADNESPLGYDRQLWKLDGTEAELIPLDAALPERLMEFNEHLYFTAMLNEKREALFTSDGTAEGTTLFKDFFDFFARVDPETIQPDFIAEGWWELDEFEIVGDRLFFTAGHTNTLASLWGSDGTQAGTLPIEGTYSSPNQLTAFNGRLFFNGRTDSTGRELFVSDGTNEGTGLFADLEAGEASASPRHFIVSGGALYFISSIYDVRQWHRSDGTFEGTVVLEDSTGAPLRPQTNSLQFADHEFRDPSGQLATLNDAVFAVAHDEVVGAELMMRPSGQSAFSPVKDINGATQSSEPSDFIVLGDQLIFTADDGIHGRELWVSDGNEGSATLLAELVEGPASSRLFDFTVVGDQLYFMNVSDTSVYRTDGTAEGTELVVTMDGTPLLSVLDEDTLLIDERFETSSRVLWTLNIQTGETTRLANSSGPPTVVDGGIYFFGNNETLMRSDGTVEGTTELIEIEYGTGFGNTRPTLIAAGDTLYFLHSRDGTQIDISVTDGTEEGTRIIAEFTNGGGVVGVSGNALYVMRNQQLYRLNGEGITQLSDDDAGRVFSIDGELDNELYFSVLAEQTELWKTDGASGGTQRMLELTNRHNVFFADQQLYVVTQAEDEAPIELWQSDGASDELVFLATLDSFPSWLGSINGDLYLEQTDDEIGSELFRLVQTIDDEPVCKPSSGDMDGDGVVGFTDFLTLSAAFGKDAESDVADLDCDGAVGFTDFLILSANFGTTVGAQAVDAVFAAS